MAKKRKRKAHAVPPGQRPEQTSARRAQKEEARRAREAAIKRASRREGLRRGLTIAATGAVVFAVFLYLTRAGAPKPIPDAALAAAKAAGCGDVQTPASDAPGNQHVPVGQSVSYPQHPATSGQHYGGSELPAEPHVYTTPVDEPTAVHNLEHAYVLIYYRSDGPDALPGAVVQSLASLANQESKVIMAPYPQLPQGTSLALVAWNKLWECPSTVAPDQARTIARGFIDAYRGTSNAPEPKAP